MSIFKRKEQEKNIINEQENDTAVFTEEETETLTLGQKLPNAERNTIILKKSFLNFWV